MVCTVAARVIGSQIVTYYEASCAYDAMVLRMDLVAMVAASLFVLFVFPVA